MTQSKAREIVSSLSSLYPLSEIEEEAIITLLEEKEADWDTEKGIDRCPCCGNKWIDIYRDNFCSICGQPIKRGEL